MKFGEDWSKREPVNFVFDHLVQFWIMSIPKPPPPKLKPEYCRQANTQTKTQTYLNDLVPPGSTVYNMLQRFSGFWFVFLINLVLCIRQFNFVF